MTIFHIDHLPNEISLPSSSKYCFVLSWLDENSLFTDSNHSLYFITTMSNHSAKQIQSYRQSDVEIKNPIWLAEWKVPFFYSRRNYIKLPVCWIWQGYSKRTLHTCTLWGQKKKSPEPKLALGKRSSTKFAHNITDDACATIWQIPTLLGRRGYILTFWGICNLKAMALQQSNRDEHISLIAVLVSGLKLRVHVQNYTAFLNCF